MASVKSEVAMPAAAKLMAEHDLPVGSVQGTGRGGRVTKGDVLEALGASPAAAAPSARSAPPAPARAPAPTPAPHRRPGRCRLSQHPRRRSSATGRSSACR